MKRSYNIASARSKLAEIVDEVEAGADVELVRRGKKVAVLVSPARYARLSGARAAFGDAYDAFLRGRDPASFGAAPGTFDEARDRSAGRKVDL